MSRVSTAAVPDQRSDQQTGGIGLYILRTDDGRIVKLGASTKRYWERRGQIQGTGPGAPTYHFVCGWRGVPSDENYLHRQFAHLNARDNPRPWNLPVGAIRSKEWFWADPELTDWIKWLVRQPFVTDDEDMSWTTMDPVTSDYWSPTDADNGQPRLWDSSFGENTLALSRNWWDAAHRPGVITGDDYYTHRTVIEVTQTFLGTIDLDPASHFEANKVVGARNYFTLHENGLVQPWNGRVWLNPPFGQWDAWGAKVLRELDLGRVSELILLIPDRSLSTRGGVMPLLRRGDAFCQLHGRWPFWGPKATGSPDDGHALLYFGNRVAEFRVAFAALGTTFIRGDQR